MSLTQNDIKEIKKEIDKIIYMSGIPKYIVEWNKKKKEKEEQLRSKIKVTNIKELNDYLKLYHRHTHVYQIKEEYFHDDRKKMVNKLPEIKIKKGILIIKYYEFMNELKPDINEFITKVYKQINMSLNNTKGMIIDLRKHYGGNMYPFIYSLAKILNNTTLLAFTNKEASKKDKVWINMMSEELKFSQEYLTDKLSVNFPIAIVIGNKTASAGEFDALIFKGRKNVKFFGGKTYGLLSANKSVNIKNKVMFNYTGALSEDVKFKFYTEECLEPDVYTKKPEKEAIEWINENS